MKTQRRVWPVVVVTLLSVATVATSAVTVPLAMRGSAAERGAPPPLTDEQCQTIFKLHNLDQELLAPIGAATNEAGLGADLTDASNVNLGPATARELAGLLGDGIRAQRASETPAFVLPVEDAAIRFDAALAAALRGYARRVGAGADPAQALTDLFADARVLAAGERYNVIWLPIVERCGLFPDATRARQLVTLTRTAAEAHATVEIPLVAQSANTALLTFLNAFAEAVRQYADAVGAGHTRVDAASVVTTVVAPVGAAADDVIRELLERCRINVGLNSVTSMAPPLSEAECGDVFSWYRSATTGFAAYNRALREANINLLQTGIAFPGNLGAVDLDGGLLLSEGVYTPLVNVPGAFATSHTRMNERGWIAGASVATPDNPTDPVSLSAFIMRDGVVKTIDVAGASSTIALGINDAGEVVGGYVEPEDVNPTGESPTRGFLWHRGRFTLIDFPGSQSTAPYEINNRGQIVGNYVDAAGVQHGFVLHRRRFTSIDHPNATNAPNMTATRLVGINDAGWIVGSYGDDAGIIHAFLRSPDGEFTAIDPPGAAALAEASNINAHLQIVGRYQDATPTLLSFLRRDGEVVTLDALGRCDTAAFDINDRGVILLTATDASDGSTCTRESMDVR